VDTAFASEAPERAGLAAILNAWMLVALPSAVLGAAVGQAVFPRLAAHADSADWARMRQTVTRALTIMVVLTIPALAVLIVFGRPLVHILFEHGKFDAAAGTLTYRMIVPYALALPAYVGTEIITRSLIALRDPRTPLITNTFQLGGRIILIVVLMPRLGVVAIPISFAISSAIEAVALRLVLKHKLNRREQVLLHTNVAQYVSAPVPDDY
jgi:putative peptidoglycan lipid II flippase